MKLLVIGAQGQLARSLVEVSKFQTSTVVACGRPELDLLMPETIARAVDRVQPHLVINTAAYTAVDKAESERELAFAINTEGAARVAEVCALRNIPLIHISTDFVFDGKEGGPYGEEHEAKPLNIYGHSKLEGEQQVSAVGGQHVILRTAWLHSPFGQNFVKTMLRLARSRVVIDVVADQCGNPTYAPHLALSILSIANKILAGTASSISWGVYHLAGTGEVTWSQLAQEIFLRSEQLGGPIAKVRQIATADYPTPARRPADSRLDCSGCLRAFGERLPEWTIGVAECVTQLLKHDAEGLTTRAVRTA